MISATSLSACSTAFCALVDEGRLDLGPLRRILLGILITQKPTSARLRGRAVDRLSLPITRLSRLEFLTVSVLPLV